MKSNRNKTITLSYEEIQEYSKNLLILKEKTCISNVINKTIHQDTFSVLPFLPESSVDLLILDPPYNLTKDFNGSVFKKTSNTKYENWLNSVFIKIIPLLKKSATIYVCSEWSSSLPVQQVLNEFFIVQNRITWEREKGRGAKTNWKNCSEDIWFCTLNKDYVFNVEDVKLKRKVLAPYTQDNIPKDWYIENNKSYRNTYPSNLWTDITIPFWSMAENTNHPTQKPEKLVAKLILASSNKGDLILDPFVGSGTTSVVAKKLNRNYIGIDNNLEYCCLTEKRLQMTTKDNTIQGYTDGVFWERNSK